MSMDYEFTQTDVRVNFKDKQDMDNRIKAFEKDVQEHDTDYNEGEKDYPLNAMVERVDNELCADILIGYTGEDTPIDIKELIRLICKHFPTANGNIYCAGASVSTSGFVRECGGNTWTIENGKEVLSDYKAMLAMKSDMYEVLDYLKGLLGKDVEDESKCAIAHIYNQYMSEEK